MLYHFYLPGGFSILSIPACTLGLLKCDVWILIHPSSYQFSASLLIITSIVSGAVVQKFLAQCFQAIPFDFYLKKGEASSSAT